MKNILIFFVSLAFSLNLQAQEPEPFQFKEFKKVNCTPIKNQQQTGTCWSFSAVSFLESELMKAGKGEQNLSEMFVVRNIYRDKCENYVRRQGTAQLGEGGLGHDVINAVRKYGIVPEDIYTGRKDANTPYNHSKLEATLKEKCASFVKLGKEGKLPKNYLNSIDSILDAEFGPITRKFSINNIPFTPLEYASNLGLNMDDYISITSFLHQPMWKPFILEVPDNFSNGLFYNLPLDEMMRCLNYSIQQGYSVEWDADVSNPGFAAKYGLAIVPEKEWKDKNDAQRANSFKFYEPEKNITAEYRQELFDRQETMDDHLMHIVGILDEGHSGLYYVVKNSWGEISDFKGFVYTSEAYMRQNTISFLVNKNALPTDIRRRIGLEAGEFNIDKKKESPTKKKSDDVLEQVTPSSKSDQKEGTGRKVMKPRPAEQKAKHEKE
jgi:bleomycin hydrolase